MDQAGKRQAWTKSAFGQTTPKPLPEKPPLAGHWQQDWLVSFRQQPPEDGSSAEKKDTLSDSKGTLPLETDQNCLPTLKWTFYGKWKNPGFLKLILEWGTDFKKLQIDFRKKNMFSVSEFREENREHVKKYHYKPRQYLDSLKSLNYWALLGSVA